MVAGILGGGPHPRYTDLEVFLEKDTQKARGGFLDLFDLWQACGGVKDLL